MQSLKIIKLFRFAVVLDKLKKQRRLAYTLEDFRGKEYGIEVTNAGAIEIKNQNRIALYSTSFDNFSSQSIAKKLKLIQYGTDIHIS